ncbi:TerD family protein [Nakamurella leprariae]|uniref:TerD family protein n=1 Tax=Nakamurella leprariae TaxID=2803911 RepID=A0A938YDM8_9ACTN|nr:TerD family protein [Nakamurella leprariae]MBM9466507.1 TerD family protein [Nakamurella leprariae]
MANQWLMKGQNVPLESEVTDLTGRVHWTTGGPSATVDVIALLVGDDRRVRSDADMVFYNQTSTPDGSVTHAQQLISDDSGSDAVALDLAVVPDDVQAIVIAASSDAELAELSTLEWHVEQGSGEAIAGYRVDQLTTERVLVLGEVYRRNGGWRLRAVGQGWEGGLAGLATDFGVQLDDQNAEDGGAAGQVEADDGVLVDGSSDADADVVAEDPAEPRAVAPADADAPSGIAAVMPDVPSSREDRGGSSERRSRARSSVRPKRVATRRVTVPRPALAGGDQWQSSRLFSVYGVGSTDEQEKRATSALLWALSAVRPLGRALTARAGAPAGAIETFTEVQFSLGDHKVIPDGIIRAARAGRVWTACVEVKTGDAQLQRPQVESYLRLARRQKFDTVLTISNQVSTDHDRHPVEVAENLLKNVRLIHISWSEVMHEIRMLVEHHAFTDQLEVWILSELLRYLEHPKSGAMSFHDMGPDWVKARDAAKASTLRPGDAAAVSVVDGWNRLSRQLRLSLTARLGVPVRQVLPRRIASDGARRDREYIERLAGAGELSATFSVPDAVGPITVTADLRTSEIRLVVSLDAPKEGALTRRVSWLTRQLKESPGDLLVEAQFSPHSETTCERLADVREKPGVLIPGKDWEPDAFTLRWTQPMGTKRSGVKGGFVWSVTHALDEFYSQTVEHLRPWTPPPPQLPEGSASADLIEDAGDDATG